MIAAVDVESVESTDAAVRWRARLAADDYETLLVDFVGAPKPASRFAPIFVPWKFRGGPRRRAGCHVAGQPCDRLSALLEELVRTKGSDN